MPRKIRELIRLKESARYPKIVEWSNEDQCFVGSCPGLFSGGCHGTDEKQVFEELCQMVEEMIDLYHQDGKPLPPVSDPKVVAREQELESGDVTPMLHEE